MPMDEDQMAIEDCGYERGFDAGGLEKDVEEQDVDQDGSEQGKGQGKEVARQQQDSDENLSDGNRLEQVTRLPENAQEPIAFRRCARHGVSRKEVVDSTGYQEQAQ
jgi:hypothetical protein